MKKVSVIHAVVVFSVLVQAKCWAKGMKSLLVEKIEDSRSCDNKRALNVTISINLYALLEIDGSQQTISLKQGLHLFWADSALSWNATEYDDIDAIYLPTNMICFPDLVLEESIETFLLPPKSVMLDVMVRSSGEVVTFYPHTYRGSCPLDVSLYPFDTQRCKLSFWSTLRDISSLDIYPLKETPDIGLFQKNSEWSLIGFRASRTLTTGSTPSFVDRQFASVTYDIHFARKPLFYIINVVVPSSVVALVAIVGFFAPSESSGLRKEKVTLGITTLLSMAILLLTISTRLPVTSDVVPLLSEFFGALIIVITIATMLSSIIISIHYAGDVWKKKPNITFYTTVIAYIGKVVGPSRVDVYRQYGDVVQGESAANSDSTRQEEKTQAKTKTLASSSETLSKCAATNKSCETDNKDIELESKTIDFDTEKPKNVTIWQEICDTVDRLLMILLFTISLCIIIWFMSNA